MLVNVFTPEEIAACTPGAALNCTKSLTVDQTAQVAFTAGQRYMIQSLSGLAVVLVNNFNSSHMIDGPFLRKHFSLDKPREVIHLSETGFYAGRRFCGAAKDDGNRSVHAMYAPLQNPDFRTSLCEACLTVWALNAYDDGEAMPDYIAEVRRKHNAVTRHGTPGAAQAHQLALEMQ